MKVFKHIILLCLLVLLYGVLTAGFKNKIMLINSSGAVEKYNVAQEAFKKTIPQPIIDVNLNEAQLKLSDVEDLLYDEYPDLIYCIGIKAYLIANKFVSEKNIVFSSIINWRRLPMTKNTYGVASELHPGFHLTLYRYIFPKIKNIGVLYSGEYNRQWIDRAQNEARTLGIEIMASDVTESRFAISTLKTILPEIDAQWLISDPVVMADKLTLLEIFKASDAASVPVFSYHPAFTESRAVLIVSVDNPTIGHQAAAIAKDVLTGDKPEERVQLPAGSHIALNLNKIKAYGIHYEEMALGSVNQIIE